MCVVILGLILAIVIPLGNIPGRYAGLVVLMFAGFMQSPSKFRLSLTPLNMPKIDPATEVC